MKYYIIKQGIINIFIYFINYGLSLFIPLKILIHIICFVAIVILLDAVIIQDELKNLDIKYNNLIKNIDINTDIAIIKSKIDLLTSLLNKTIDNKTIDNKSIDININKSPEFDYKLARTSLISSKSLSFKKSPKKKEMEIPILNIGEILSYTLK